MYVCLCHGFTEDQVRAAAAGGCRTPGAVYRALCGERAKCCKCVPEVCALIGETQAALRHSFAEAAE